MTLLVGKEQKMFHGQVESGFDWVLKEAEGAHTRFGVHSSNPISMQKSTSEEGVEITSYSLGDKFFKLTENHQNGAILLQEWNT